jgi:signal peptidase I
MRTLSRAVAAALAALALCAGIGLATGTLSLVTTSGTSMAPRMAAGDLVLVRAAGYGLGDVVAYRSPELDRVVLHRIVAVEGDELVFQGDNNDFLDPERLTAEHVIGKELLHVPRGGTWLERLTSPPALAACTFLLLAGSAAVPVTRQRRKERRTMSPRHRSTSRGSLAALPPVLRNAAAASAALALVGVVLTGLSWTRPATTTAAATASVDFSYTATVPASAAYDGTTVVAPQPVFRALTDSVDVGYAYVGRPGTIAVDAELSSSSGWRSTVELAGTQPLAARDEGTVTLELGALEARAQAAAAVTGIPVGSLTVTVVPRIEMDGGGQFAPALPLTVTPLTLEAGEQAALSAATATEGTAAVPAQLSAFGRSTDVSTVRTASVAVLLLAALAGAVVSVLARRAGPVAEAERIRRRHKDLLLPVHPVALTPGRPVVDVASVEDLGRLAERYGLLVLHWTRSGVTTYVVQEEGSTYRYRSSLPAEVPETALV